MTAKKTAKRPAARKSGKKPTPSTDEAEVTIDFSALTPNQMVAMENELNCDFSDAIKAMTEGAKAVDDDGNRIRSGRITQVLTWVLQQTDNPSITIAEAGAVPLGGRAKPNADGK